MAPQSSVDGKIREYRAVGTHAGWRLDHFLAKAIPEFSRSRLQTDIAEGRVTHGDQTIRDPNRRVKPGEVYAIRILPPKPALPQAQAIPLNVLYEDDDLIVVDKEAGLVVHPAAGNLDGTLVNALLAHCGPTLSGIGGVARPGIVHRLDKNTSGILVAAKNERAMRSLAKQFAAHAVERAYNAVIWSAPHQRQGRIEGNVGRNPFDRKRMAVLRGQGKPASTRYMVLERYAMRGKPLAALLGCQLETGRTHQIRVHLAHLGHPLVGDTTYGRARLGPRPRLELEKTAIEAVMEFPRQALHAGMLGFFHPSLQKTMRFESPWPGDFANLVNALRGLDPHTKP